MRTGSKFVVALTLAMTALPALAQEAAAPSPVAWQSVIAGQIRAFRAHDAPTALSLAGAAFQQTFTDPKQFFLSIIASGYAPIMESHEQSFGPFKMIDDTTVLQDVKITGNDQVVYEAYYQLKKEAGGWRVAGVQLTKTASVGV